MSGYEEERKYKNLLFSFSSMYFNSVIILYVCHYKLWRMVINHGACYNRRYTDGWKRWLQTKINCEGAKCFIDKQANPKLRGCDEVLCAPMCPNIGHKLTD